MRHFILETETVNDSLIVELDERSQLFLKELGKKFVNTITGFKPKYYCDRYVIENKWSDDLMKYYNNHKNEKIEFQVTHIGISDKVIAVKVDTNIRTSFANKFIVIATNKSTGGKIKHADELMTWDRVGLGRVLYGKVKIHTKEKKVKSV